jgi:UDP-3-O-[3-hydroxymyristoyl] N-acetylglucosamine deacetylase
LIFEQQKTIANKISCTGIGLHSGKQIILSLLPARTDSGILFRKIDSNKQIIAEIPALYNFVSNTKLCTTISSEDKKHSIATIEHLMAALWGCSIDNIVIEIEGDEIPIMDGSSCHFKFMVECAGIKKQSKRKNIIEILKYVEAKDGESFASIEPSDRFSINMEIDFNNKAIQKQKFYFDEIESSFALDISRARTFGFLEDVEQLKKMGLGLGGNLDNVVVVDKDKVINKDGLRFKDEFVRHKVLDSIGDLYLAGAYIKGDFTGIKSGHTLNNKLLHELFKDSSAYRLIKSPFEGQVEQSFVA